MPAEAGDLDLPRLYRDTGQPGARDTEVIWHGAGWLLSGLKPPVALRVVVEDGEFRLGPDSGSPLTLTTSRFEAFRWRMGRRSRDQLAALDWSADPAPVIDHLVVFGPAASDIAEQPSTGQALQAETRSHTKMRVSPGAITRPAPRSP